MSRRHLRVSSHDFVDPRQIRFQVHVDCVAPVAAHPVKGQDACGVDVARSLVQDGQGASRIPVAHVIAKGVRAGAEHEVLVEAQARLVLISTGVCQREDVVFEGRQLRRVDAPSPARNGAHTCTVEVVVVLRQRDGRYLVTHHHRVLQLDEGQVIFPVTLSLELRVEDDLQWPEIMDKL